MIKIKTSSLDFLNIIRTEGKGVSIITVPTILCLQVEDKSGSKLPSPF